MTDLYTDPDTKQASITPKAFSSMKPHEQIKVMKAWFYERYEDPVHNMPWDSEEKDYVFVGGGPYEASEELDQEFGGVVDDEVITQLANDLDDECPRWAGVRKHEDYYDEDEDLYQFQLAVESGKPINHLKKRLAQLRAMLELKDSFDESLQESQRMMIYSFAITSMEAYLLEVFAQGVMESEEAKRRYWKSELTFGTEKMKISDVFDYSKTIDAEIKRKIANILFHKLDDVSKLFHEVLQITPRDIPALKEAVLKRHDFVHRFGKNQNGELVGTTRQDVVVLIDLVEAYCSDIYARSVFGDKPAEYVLPASATPLTPTE